MPDRKSSQSPVVAARNMVPWWMGHIKDFDGLEILPCRLVGYDVSGHEIVKPCELAQVSFWTVYGHYNPNGHNQDRIALDDFDTKSEAQRFYNRLTDAFPHLFGFRARLRPLSERKTINITPR